MDRPKWVREKLDPLQPSAPRILVVEGVDDVLVYQKWAEKLTVAAVSPFATGLTIIDADNKSSLLKGLVWLRDFGDNPTNVFGIVDRGEWAPDRAKAMQQDLPQLRVNESRHCLESHFCDPDELDAALLSKDEAKYRSKVTGLRSAIAAARDLWVPHWALWVTLQRTHVELTRDDEFPSIFHGEHPLPDDGEIKKRLAAWAKILDPKLLFTAFDRLRTSAMNQKHRAQYRSYIYAKDFYPQVVKPLLQKLDPAIPADDWKLNIADWSPDAPADIRAILEPLLQ